ncbi:MAG TPA: hypothetical protein PLF54_10555 [Deltaproteobacteria bacterium]|jgi:hypothetical protein|nr:hypothetical protein [Deltaproteobacteria bacterium]HQJ09431.1 hypothetical protein [Deltaproteobacteria bacterium]
MSHDDPYEELTAIGKHITADGRLLEKRAAALAKYTEELVANLENEVIYDGWEAKYDTFTNPDTGQVAHHSKRDAFENAAIVSAGLLPLDERMKKKLIAYEKLLPVFREEFERVPNADTVTIVDVESGVANVPYLFYMDWAPPGFDVNRAYEVGFYRFDWFGMIGEKNNPERKPLWSPITISLFGNLSPAILAPVYKRDNKIHAFFEFHWDLVGLMRDTIDRSESRLLVISDDESILIGINTPAREATGIQGFVRGQTRQVEELMLGQRPLAEVQELAKRVKARETGFVLRLNGRNYQVCTHYVPEILNGMTLVKLIQP